MTVHGSRHECQRRSVVRVVAIASRWGSRADHLGVVTVARAATFPAVAVDCLLQFVLSRQVHLFALVLVQVLHVSETERERERDEREDDADMSQES